MVNHSENFVAPNKGNYIPNHLKRLMKPITTCIAIHTQTIESRWNQLKQKIRNHRGIKSENLQNYINEVQWANENEKALVSQMIKMFKIYFDIIKIA